MNTSTVPNLTLAWNAVTGALPSPPTVAIDDLAWSNEDTVVRRVTSVPPVSSRRGSSALLLAAITAVLLGVISVVAALVVLAVDSSGVPRTETVRDATHSVPAAQPSLPAPRPNMTNAPNRD